MWKRLIFSVVVLAAVLTPLTTARGQTDARSPVPDISGVWLVEKFQPRLFLNGGAPFTPWAEMKFKATDLQTNDPNLACLPEGVPRFMIAVPYPMEVFSCPRAS